MLGKPSPDSKLLALVMVGAVGVWLALAGLARCQEQAPNAPENKDKPAATVKVEVKEPREKGQAQVKVEVSGKDVKADVQDNKGVEAPTKRPPLEERIAPVDPKKIEEAGKKIGEKIDKVARRSSKLLGSWVTATAFNGITWLKVMITFLILLGVLVVERLLSYLIYFRIQRLEAKDTPPTWGAVFLEALRKPLSLFIWVYGAYFAISPLLAHFDTPFEPNTLKGYVRTIADLGGVIAMIWLMYRVIRLVDLELEMRARSPESRIDDLQASLVGKTLRWVVAIAGFIILAQYVTGIQAGPLIASLGIGGLAVALAAKESIANLFGTVTIVFDKPFKVGDRIVIDKYDGFVEEVGYRSTKLRLWSGNLVNIPNDKITNSNVENFARRPHIWWRADITITYDTPPEKVDRAVEIIREVIQSDEETSVAQPPWVFFSGFNDWSLNLRVTAWFTPFGKEPSQYDYYTWRERNCRQILRRFNEEGIQFAFPTGTTYLANDDTRQLKMVMLRGEMSGTDGKTPED